MKQPLNPIFCCLPFENRIGDAGLKGLAVLVVKTSEGLKFRLQSRGIAFEDESKIRPKPGGPDININVSGNIRFEFCPFCGRRVRELIEVSPQAFEALAEKHKKFVGFEL